VRILLLLILIWPVHSLAQTPNVLVSESLSFVGDVVKPNVVSLQSPDGQVGSGLVVAQSRDKWLVVTAGHVVEGAPANGQVSVTFLIDPHTTAAATGKVVFPRAGPTESQDFAFIEVPKVANQGTLKLTWTNQVNVGDWVSSLGSAGAWQFQAPGQILSGAIGGLVHFGGAGIAPSYSGGPLFTRQGLAGIIVLQVDSGDAYALLFAPIKARFDEVFRAEGWAWLLDPAPHAIPTGFVILKRLDGLGGFASITAQDGKIYQAPNNQTVIAPAGNYSIGATSVAGTPLSCEPAALVVTPNTTSSYNESCSTNLSGTWRRLDGATLTLSSRSSGGFDAKLTGDPFWSATGEAAGNDQDLQMTMHMANGATWVGHFSATPDELTGSIAGPYGPILMAFSRVSQ
jgi:hypothetical protein